MPSGDGLVVRVRPPCGRLTQPQAQGVAALASRHAWPVLDLTGRANLQLRGVPEADYPPLMHGLQALGLVDASHEAEARRNLLVTPFWQLGDGTLDLAEALGRALASPQAPVLPAKFGFALDGGDSPVLRGSPADIRIERDSANGMGYLVVADGSRMAAPAGIDDVVPLAIELAQWFAASAASGGPQVGRGRMAALLSRQPLPRRFAAVSVRVAPPVTPLLGLVPQGCVVGFEFGQLPVATLAALAALGDLRLTPWRSLLVEGLHEVPRLEGVITRTDDVRLRVAACTGAPGCTQGAAATRGLARHLAPLVPGHRVLHVSGCAKGCAHPGATLTLVATAAGFDLVHHGTAASAPDRTALDAAAIATHLQNLPHAPPV